MTLCWFKW